MPHSTNTYTHTRRNGSLQLSLKTSFATTPTGSSLVGSLKGRSAPARVKPRPRSIPGNWDNLLGASPNHSNTSSRRSSVHAADALANQVAPSDRQDSHQHLTPHAMGGNRTSLSMNGGLDHKRRTMSYEEQYQYKDNVYGSARERVHRESPVLAELRTNVIVSIAIKTHAMDLLTIKFSRSKTSSLW